MAYIIAEIGQNHNGDAENAIKLIDMAARHGCNAVKMTKRDLTAEMSNEMWNTPYDSQHAFGSTYGEHRAALELSYLDHLRCYEHATKLGLDFIETACNVEAARTLYLIGIRPRYWKIASRDWNNTPLWDYVFATGIPVIVSTGFVDQEADMFRVIDYKERFNNEIVVLHCVSSYPCEYAHTNLSKISLIRELFHDYNIKVGFSDHTTGVLAPALAVAFGADYIEKHITLSHDMKGTDHAGSMDEEGLRRVVRDVRNAEIAAGSILARKFIDQKTVSKLGRSIAYRKNIKVGSTVDRTCFHMISPGDGLTDWDIVKTWTKANRDLRANDLVKEGDLT